MQWPALLETAEVCSADSACCFCRHPSTGGASLPRNLSLEAFAGRPPSAKTLCLYGGQKQEKLADEPTSLALYYASGMKTGKLGTAGSIDGHKILPPAPGRSPLRGRRPFRCAADP